MSWTGPVVLLDRIEPGWTPPYCTHGRATCMGCDNWVWLGSETAKLVTAGDAAPLCLPCADRLIPPDSRTPDRHVADHRRADGPHED